MNRKRIHICFVIIYVVSGIIAGGFCLEQEQNEDKMLQVSEGAKVQEEKAQESLVHETDHLNDIQDIENLQSELKDSTEEEVSVPETEEEQTNGQSKYGAIVKHVGDSRLNVRKQPSLSSEVIGSMVEDDVAQVLEIGEEWHLIRFRDLEGYVFAKYIELIEMSENDKP